MTTLPALPGLLDGWSGPVDYLCRPGDTAPSDTLDGWEPTAGRNGWIWHPDSGSFHPVDAARVRLDLSRPEVRSRVCAWLAAGACCPNCFGGGVRVGLLTTHPLEGAPCANCAGTGYTRPPHRCFWMLPSSEGGTLTDTSSLSAADLSAELLRWSALSVAAGGLPVAGVLSEWRYDASPDGDDLVWRRVIVAGAGMPSPAVRGVFAGHDAGRARSDAHYLSARYALLGDGAILPPLPGDSR